MTVQDVKGALGKVVHFSSTKTMVDADFIFKAYILREFNGKAVQQAELHSLTTNSAMIVPLSEVELKE